MTQLDLHHVHHGRLVAVSTQRLLTAAVALAGMGAACAALLVASPGTPAWPAACVMLAALAAAVAPDSLLGLGTFAGYGVWWLLVLPDELTGWALPAALGLLVAHTALAWAATGPATLVSDPQAVAGWLRDVLLVAAATSVVWWVPRLADPGWRAPEALLGLALAACGSGLWLLARNARESTVEGNDPETASG